jgi:hypothetical protein
MRIPDRAGDSDTEHRPFYIHPLSPCTATIYPDTAPKNFIFSSKVAEKHKIYFYLLMIINRESLKLLARERIGTKHWIADRQECFEKGVNDSQDDIFPRLLS